MNDKRVVEMAGEGYAGLRDDVDGELPDFDEAMAQVRAVLVAAVVLTAAIRCLRQL